MGYEEKDDVFALGIIVLGVCTKKDWQTFYNFSENQVNFSKIEYELDELEKRGFTKKLLIFLKESLRSNPKERASL